MQVNKFTTMAVGLIVGVLLIAGVVTPVIADVSENSGSSETYTNIGTMTCSFANENTDVHIYPVAEDKVSFQPESVADRTVYDLTYDWVDGKSFVVFLHSISQMGDNSWDYTGATYISCKVVDGTPSLIWEENYNNPYSEIVIDGTDFICKSDGAEDYIDESDVVCYWDPINPTHVDTVEANISTQTININSAYLTDESKVLICLYRGEITGDNSFTTVWDGTINGAFDSESFSANFPDSLAHTYDGSPQYVISDNSLESFTVTVDGTECTFSGTDYETVEGNYTNQIHNMVLPITVSGSSGGSGGSGATSTLTTVLSVVPLVLTVSLVLGAVAFFRMKD